MTDSATLSNTLTQDDVLLEAAGLRTYINTPTGMVRAVDGVDLTVRKGRILGVLGESGSGKSVMARSLLGLVQEFPGVIEGSVHYYEDGAAQNLTASIPSTVQVERSSDGSILRIAKDMKSWKRGITRIYQNLWGRKMSMIFQDPQTSLNPFWSVGEQLAEAVQAGHSENLLENDIRDLTIDWLRKVRIQDPEQALHAYPHNLSGGMCQRVMIAIALASRPSLVIADEPTTGLDATVQARIVDLLGDLQEESDLTIIVISHDIGMVSKLADDVMVMYCGQVVEYGSRNDVISADNRLRHPYTRAMLDALPGTHSRVSDSLRWIDQAVPNPKSPPEGCRFHPRCEIYQNSVANEAIGVSQPSHLAQCINEVPGLTKTSTSRRVRCFDTESNNLKVIK